MDNSISKFLSHLLLLVITSHLCAEDVLTVRFTVIEFQVIGENPLSKKESDVLLSPYLGEHDGLDGLLDAAATLEQAILEAGHSFHRVILPPQTLEAGKVNLEVVVFTLANVEVTDNQFFSEENIIRSIPGLKSGTTPNTRELSRELIVANDHVSKQVTIRIKESPVPNSVDAVLEVEDRKPWQVFGVFNNIGTDETGDYRLSLGFQHNNLLDLDDSITLSYTTSPDHVSDVKQWGFNYKIPLYPLSGSVNLFYSRSDVDSGQVQQVFDVTGAGKFIGGHYTHTFLNLKNYRHRLSVGVEDKLFEDKSTFLGTPIGVDVRSRPFIINYSGDYRQETSSFKFNVSFIHNLNGGNRNNDRTYTLARLGADQDWNAIRYAAYLNHLLPKNWVLNIKLIGQYTNELLIDGEQLGIGGIYSIRGFEERAVSGDRGNQATLEVWTPPFANNIRILGFLDAGHVKRIKALAGEISNESLASIGIGLRWQWRDQLSIAIDYGHEINGAKTPGAGGVKTHFNVFYRF